MNWYFIEGDQRMGPFDDAGFSALVEQGRVTADTLVWHEGMPDWGAYAAVAPAAAPAGDPSAIAEPSAAPGGAAAKEFCSQCGRYLPREELLDYEGAWVCADCKPAFFQRILEGVEAIPQVGLQYAGFWIRFAAKFIDGLILALPTIGLAFGLMWLILDRLTFAPGRHDAFELLIFLQILIQLIAQTIPATYTTLMHGRYGATVGKMACGLRVVTPDGGKISYKRAFARAMVEVGANLLMMFYWVGVIDYVVAAFDPQKRAGHDHICGTRVIRK